MTIIYNNTSTVSSHLLPYGYVQFNSNDLTIKKNPKLNNDSSKRLVNPHVYFQLVKNKLTDLENEKLDNKIKKLFKIINKMDEIGQKAAYEEYSKELVKVVKYSAISVCQYNKFIDIKSINIFKKIQKLSKIIYFKKLEEFPRVIPEDISNIIKQVKEKEIFDELWVLYLDYTNEELKTNKEKIKEKDPILFGKINECDEKYFFIVDWIDEYCDLTLSKFIDIMGENDNCDITSNINDIIDSKYMKNIFKEVDERRERLKKTNSSNFRELMEEEDKPNINNNINNNTLFSKFKNKLKGIFKR